MIITSLKNPSVKLARALRQKKYRKLHGMFLVEGIRLLKEAVDNNAKIKTIFHCPEKLKSEVGIKLLEMAQRKGIKILRVSEQVIKSISLKDNPQGIIGIVKSFQSDLRNLSFSQNPCILWAHEIRDPGNIGTMIRTCDAFGIDAFILTGNSADPFDPKSVRASMGSIFSIPIVLEDNPMEVMNFLRKNGFYLLATSPHAEKFLFELSYRFPLAVMMGNEGEGLPNKFMKIANERVKIPMIGRADSLNVSVAAGVILYEVNRSKLYPSNDRGVPAKYPFDSAIREAKD